MALANVAHPTIRNRGTTVGSLVHADAAAEMPVVLRLLGGSIEVESAARGRRTIPADELFLGPLESSVEHDEIATAAFFPALPAGAGVAFEEIARRHGDYALCGVAALVDGETVRAGYLSVSDVPDRRRPQRRAGGAVGRRGPRAARPGRRHPCHRRLPRPPGADPDRPGRPGGVRRCGRQGMSEELHSVRLTVNGTAHDVTVPARRLLSDALRHDLGLTGTHVGCEHGVCGACTVLRGRTTDAVLPDVRGLRGRRRDHHRRGADQPRRVARARSSRRSRSATACSAASARPASSPRSPPACARTRTPPTTRPGR